MKLYLLNEGRRNIYPNVQMRRPFFLTFKIHRNETH